MAALDPNALKDSATRFLKGFSPSQLVIIGLLGAVGVTGVVFFLKWVSTPTYGVLMAGLDAKDAAAVTAKLQSDGVPYKLASGGSTVLVPQSSLDKERLSVAAAGLPEGSTSNSWAAFDKQGLTSSSFQQQVAYQRALESTLADSLQKIDGIRSAEVHLALPEQRLFTQDKQAARASVLVQAERTPGSGTVDAMTHLIASAVPNLDAKDVSITDGNGTLLTSGTDASGARLDEKRSGYEDALSAQVTSMLDTVLGPGHAVVRVNAEIDSSSTTVDSQVYDPKKSVVLSSKTTTEQYAPGTSPTTSGVVTASPAPTTASSSGNGNGYTKTDSTSTNGVSVTTSHSVTEPGGLKRLTVAVAVDGNVKKGPNMVQVQDLVSNAVGLNPKRGDTITVTSQPFASTTEAAAKKTADKGPGVVGTATSHLPEAVGGLVLLLVGLGLLKSVRHGTSTDVPLEQVTAAVEARRRAELLGGSAPLGLPAGSVPAQRTEDGLAGSDDEVAGLLRGWLASSGTQQ